MVKESPVVSALTPVLELLRGLAVGLLLFVMILPE